MEASIRKQIRVNHWSYYSKNEGRNKMLITRGNTFLGAPLGKKRSFDQTVLILVSTLLLFLAAFLPGTNLFGQSVARTATAARPAATQFQRGDSNTDSSFDISDAVSIIGFLFRGIPERLPCDDAADTNDDGRLDIAEGISSLGFLFRGGLNPPAPSFDCGLDPTEDDLGCESSGCPVGPPIVCPENATLYTSSVLGLPVEYQCALANPQQEEVQSFCFPPSGSIFPLGTSVVHCYAADPSGVTSEASFTITVLLREEDATNDVNQIVVLAPEDPRGTGPTSLVGGEYRTILTINFSEWVKDPNGLLRGSVLLDLPVAGGLLFGGETEGVDESGVVNINQTVAGWEVHFTRSIEEDSTRLSLDHPTLETAESNALELLYVPLNIPGLVAARVDAQTGIAIERAGEFELNKIGPGIYELWLPTRSLATGQLILSLEGSSRDASVSFGTRIDARWENGRFVIETRATVPGEDGTDARALRRDVDFMFAWVDLVGPSTPAAANSCYNGGLEEGHLGGFSGATGKVKLFFGADVGQWHTGLVNGRHTLMPDSSWAPTGFDPEVGGTTMPVVRQGAHSVRLGNNQDGKEKEKISYTFTVDHQNKFFTFSYAVVLEDPGHATRKQPYFEYRIYPKGKDHWWSRIAGEKKRADSSDPYFLHAGAGLLYRNWDCEEVYLGGHVGQEVTITFIIKDCSKGAHFGYAYIDSLCEPPDDSIDPVFTLPNPVCLNDPIIADGTPSVGETDYFWSIEVSDASWGRNPSTEVYKWFHSSQAGPIDLKAFYASFGRSFECDTYYRIKLAVANNCVGWKETVQLLYVRCPDVDAGPDLFVCLGNGEYNPEEDDVRLGTPAEPGYTYSWSPSAGLSDPAAAQPTLSVVIDDIEGCGYSWKFVLTATDPNGCVGTDTVVVHYLFPLELYILDPGPISCCDRRHRLTVSRKCHGLQFPPGTTFEWSPGGETTQSIYAEPSTNVSVTVTTPCGTYSESYVLPPDPHPIPSGVLSPSRFVHPNAIIVGHSDPKVSHFFLQDLNVFCGTDYAYDATDYLFEVWNRWGGRIVELRGTGCGFSNCTIPWWDGRATITVSYPWWQWWRDSSEAGQYVQEGVYVMRMYMKNCTKSWMEVVPAQAITVIR